MFLMIDMTFLGILTVLSVLFLSVNSDTIRSSLVTNWGDWDPYDECINRYAYGFQLKTQKEETNVEDQTALNGIKLNCDPGTTQFITSAVGNWGHWGKTFSCYPGRLTGFKLRSEADQGMRDNTAANNIIFFCSNDSSHIYLEGDGLDWGYWQMPKFCPDNTAICGMRTQIQAPQGSKGNKDDTALNNVLFQCC